jgi:integrase
MSEQNATPRRSYGSGQLDVRTDKHGREHWYGRWHAEDGRRPNRKIGLKRGPDQRDGLTRLQAEAELRRLMVPDPTRPARRRLRAGERVTLAEAEERYRCHLQVKRRKRSTIIAVESCTRIWWVPLFGDRALADIRGEDVEDAIAMMETGRRPGAERNGKPCAPKTVINYVGILGAIYHYAMHPRRRWATADPTDDIDLPELEDNTDIRFLDPVECTALAAAAIAGPFEAIDRAFYVVAAQTGLRHAELIALRWRDVDWTAMRVRVRQNYVRGEYGTPKSRRSTRSVPMSVEAGGALERLFKQSRHQDDDDLAFANPDGGGPLSQSSNRDRFRKALAAARLDTTHRIHDLRHTFGTRMAAVGTPMRTLQEWMGHRDIATTQRYADYAPGHDEADLVARAFESSVQSSVQPERIQAQLRAPKPL